jgi:hypothetical protein
MIDYKVRSESLLNIVNDIRKGRLIPDAYFQRNLVWREVHKKDFIETILLGFPFPEIFISKGKVDVEAMSTVSCIVDGQQRTNAITEFIENKFSVDNQFYKDLSEDKKSDFLKYEIAVIELDLENDDPIVQKIFQRINRTSNSLTIIEKMASEFSTSEFMLVAKLISDEISTERSDEDDFREDPNIPGEFYDWASKTKHLNIKKLVSDKGIFTARELSKKTHLMHVLNMISSIISGYFNRNDKTTEFLNDYAFEFPQKDNVVELLDEAAKIITALKLKKSSYWYNKANIFSLTVEIADIVKNGLNIDNSKLKNRLEVFESDIPSDYKLAASQSVNNKKERQLRAKYIREILNDSLSE